MNNMTWKKIILVAGLTLGLTTAVPLLQPTLTPGHGVEVARAATKKATPLYAGTENTVAWTLNTAGDLHIGAGTLPEYTTMNLKSGFIWAIARQQSGVTTPTAAELTAASDLVKTISIDGPVVAGASAQYLLGGFNQVTEIKGLENLDLSQTTNIYGFFSYNLQLADLDVSKLKTQHVSNFSFMFYNLPALKKIDISELDTSNLTGGILMFANSGFEEIDARNLDLSQVGQNSSTNIMNMFSNNSRLARLNLANVDTVNNHPMTTNWFLNDTQLASLTLGPKFRFNGNPYLTEANGGVSDTTYTGLWQGLGSGITTDPQGHKYTGSDLVQAYHTGNVAPSTVETYIWEPTHRIPAVVPPVPVVQPVKVHFVSDRGKTLAASQTLTGALGATYTTTAKTISGYRLVKTTGPQTGTFDTTAKTVTYTYTALSTGEANDQVATRQSITAVKKIGFYRQATFSAGQRMRWFNRQPRTQQPHFVVLGVRQSANGVKRYRVRDVNRGSKTYRKIGYVTARSQYVHGTYYAVTNRAQVVTVLNPAGVNAYKTAKLTGKTAHYRQGQQLKVKRLVRHNLTTRFQLTNGRYVSANKQLVQTGRHQQVKTVWVKHGINRYRDVNLTRRSGRVAAKQTLRVTNWDYSTNGTRRYRVAGGYITANSKWVTARY